MAVRPLSDILLVHGMFQTPARREGWTVAPARGHRCVAPAWPLQDGEPATLRDAPVRAVDGRKESRIAA